MTRRSMHGIVARWYAAGCLECWEPARKAGRCLAHFHRMHGCRAHHERFRADFLPVLEPLRRVPGDDVLELALAAAEESGEVPAALVAWILAGGTRPSATCAPRRAA